MIGYQGSDDPIATHALALAYARSDPSLSKVAPHLQLFESTSEQPGDAEGARRRSSISISETQNRGVVRVGFVSSYLRHHSVKKSNSKHNDCDNDSFLPALCFCVLGHDVSVL